MHGHIKTKFEKCASQPFKQHDEMVSVFKVNRDKYHKNIESSGFKLELK